LVWRRIKAEKDWRGVGRHQVVIHSQLLRFLVIINFASAQHRAIPLHSNRGYLGITQQRRLTARRAYSASEPRQPRQSLDRSNNGVAPAARFIARQFFSVLRRVRVLIVAQ